MKGLSAACVASVGCISVAGSVARPTALELQLLGEYERLDEELVHASSVRGDLAAGAGSFEMLKAEALEQRAIQRFNEDDLLELKGARCIAEALDASVVARPCSLIERDDAAARRVARVVREENRARSAILLWAAYELARKQGRGAPDPSEIGELRKLYQRLLFEAAQTGHIGEVAPGQFRELAR